ncbi:PQQ-binding-like beta-propeller repeat protein [Haloferacaceae archaeon DSL9]
MPSATTAATRRAFLSACGLAALPGCSALADDSPPATDGLLTRLRGRRRWWTGDGGTMASPAVANGYVLTVDQDGTLYAFGDQ